MITKRIQVYNNTQTDLTSFLTGMFQYYEQHGVILDYDITQVNVQTPQSSLVDSPLVGDVYVIQGAENLVPQTDHDIVLFFFQYDNWKAPWYWPWPLWGNVPRDCTYMANGKPFINIGYWPTDQTVAQRFIHEPMHALAKIFGCEDQMDTYINDNNPNSPVGNFATQWAIFKPYMETTTINQNTPSAAVLPSVITITPFIDPKLITAIIEVESSNNDNAIGDNGNAFGCMQIWQGVVDICNAHLGTSYVAKDCLGNRNLSILFFNTYFHVFTSFVTNEDRAKAWNGGAGFKERIGNPVYAQYNANVDAYWLKVQKYL